MALRTFEVFVLKAGHTSCAAVEAYSRSDVVTMLEAEGYVIVEIVED